MKPFFPQEYFVYYKGKWCTAGGKDPLFGHVDGSQIDPSKMISSFYLSRSTADRLGGGKKCIDFVF